MAAKEIGIDLPSLPTKEKLLRDAQPHRRKWGPRPAEVMPQAVGAHDESVWDYPRPPEIRDAPAPARVIFDGKVAAASSQALRVVETAGAPVYYFPPTDVDENLLRATQTISVCEWKGAAVHYDLVSGTRCAEQAAFVYHDPLDDLGCGFFKIAGWYGFYPARVDACYVGDEKVTPQPGAVYAGWVTKNIKGPIKGEPGTQHW